MTLFRELGYSDNIKEENEGFMKKQISSTEAKNHFDQLLDEVAEQGRRKVITRLGKPVAALVPLEKPRRRKKTKPISKRMALREAVGKWEDGDELYKSIMEVYRKRQQDLPRPVPDLDD